MTMVALRRLGAVTPQMQNATAAAVAPSTGSGSPCRYTATPVRTTAATPHRIARVLLLGMSLSGSLAGRPGGPAPGPNDGAGHHFLSETDRKSTRLNSSH